jgi:4'-phosphopantetheinyl transferase
VTGIEQFHRTPRATLVTAQQGLDRVSGKSQTRPELDQILVEIRYPLSLMTSQLSSWRPSPDRLRLSDRDVHVWRAELNHSGTAQSFFRILAPDERSRAEKFYFQKDRDRFIIARAILRVILSQYLHVEPDQVRFCYGPYGKPALIGIEGDKAVRFNVSHSHDLALYAVARGREVGLDVEYMREDFASEAIAEHFFSRGEVEALRELPANRRTEGFFNCWTRKEAYIKGTGLGLSLPLGQFDVSLVPGDPAALLSVRENSPGASEWSLRELRPGLGYAAAIAVAGRNWRLSCWCLDTQHVKFEIADQLQ